MRPALYTFLVGVAIMAVVALLLAAPRCKTPSPSVGERRRRGRTARSSALASRPSRRMESPRAPSTTDEGQPRIRGPSYDRGRLRGRVVTCERRRQACAPTLVGGRSDHLVRP